MKNITFKNVVTFITVLAAVATIYGVVYSIQDKPIVKIAIGDKEISHGDDVYLYYLCPYSPNLNKYRLEFLFQIQNVTKRTAKDFTLYLQSDNLPIFIQDKDAMMKRLLYDDMWKETSTNPRFQDLSLNMSDIATHTSEKMEIHLNTVIQDFSLYKSYRPYDQFDFKMAMGYDNGDGLAANIHVLPLLVDDTMINPQIRNRIKKLALNNKGRSFIISTENKYIIKNLDNMSAYCKITNIEEI